MNRFSGISFAAFDINDTLEYFHGSISRKDSERKLVEFGLVTGLFLVRVKNKVKGAYVISVCSNAAKRSFVHHTLLETPDDGWCLLNGKHLSVPCASIPEAIDHLSGSNTDITTELGMHVPREDYTA